MDASNSGRVRFLLATVQTIDCWAGLCSVCAFVAQKVTAKSSNGGCVHQLSREDFTKYRKHTFRVKKGLLQRSSKSDQGSSEEESHVPPMEDRLWMLFDPNGQGFVTFRDFVEVTSALSLQGCVE